MSNQTLEYTETGGGDGAPARVRPYLTLLYHRRFERIGQRAALRALDEGGVAGLNRAEPDFVRGDGVGGPLDDPYVSMKRITIARAGDGQLVLEIPLELKHVKLDGREVTGRHVLSVARLVEGVVIELGRTVVLLLHLHDGDLVEGEDDLGLIGHSAAMAAVRKQIRAVAPASDAVLIRGETGTGKELVAQAIAKLSRRAGKPYVVTNASQYADTDLASAHLFGALKGSHATAHQDSRGVFGAAEGGTLFFDEIGALPSEVQAVLLRVLENGRATRFGAATDSPFDVRVVFATDADLERAMAEGSFRTPFYHRIATHQLHLPPLRARREDIATLLFTFLRRDLPPAVLAYREDDKAWISASTVSALVRSDWPGNVRSLKALARHLVVQHGTAERIDKTDARITALMAATPRHDGGPEAWTDDVWLREYTRAGYSDARLAQALDWPENTVRGRLDRCAGFVRVSARPAEELARMGEDAQWQLASLMARTMATERALVDALKRAKLDPKKLKK